MENNFNQPAAQTNDFRPTSKPESGVKSNLALKIFSIVLVVVLSCAVVMLGVLLLRATNVAKTDTQESKSESTLIDLYEQVIDLGTYTTLDADLAINYLSEKYDNWGACSAAVRVNSDGQTLVGRTMDLSISDEPAYIFRTDVEGFYKTIGLTYFPNGRASYEEIVENGLDENFRALIPYFSSDSMNEYGLYVEANMRTDEYYDDGTSKFGSSGTNPDSDTRIAMSILPTYLTTHAKNIPEALELIDTLDVYSLDSESLSWPFAYMMADAEGNYGLLEIVNNEVIWHDKQAIQTNFYIAEEYRAIEDYQSGLGRYEVLANGLDAVETKKDMYNLISKVLYSQSYDRENSQFNILTEYVDLKPEWTTDYVLDSANEAEMSEYINAISQDFHTKSRAEIAESGSYWETIFTIVADATNKTFYVNFFEDPTRSFNYSF